MKLVRERDGDYYIGLRTRITKGGNDFAEGWIVIVDGIQWAPPGEPRDRAGCGGAVYPSPEAAAEAFLDAESAHEPSGR